ncbi:MAG TPA: SDR family NAD(P)-dependent oxidoreductase [Acidobacteriota bacterium]|nr:SDR family NAD(P)-dependent oxidoreductase [Acidobacteriota bacterium]
MAKRVTFLTGASSGLGWALAQLLAKDGDAVALAARRSTQLEELAGKIRAAGGEALCLPCDVIDRSSVRAAVERCAAELGPVTRLVANAGIGGPTPGSKFDAARFEQILRTNVLGAVYCIEAVLPGMLERKEGHIVGISSLAGFRGVPGVSAYSASKAALTALLESLRIELRPRGIFVTTICPGFVKTELTANRKNKMPFLMELEDAARSIHAGIRRRKRIHAFPWPFSAFVQSGKFLPAAIYDWSFSLTGLKMD